MCMTQAAPSKWRESLNAVQKISSIISLERIAQEHEIIG